MPGRAPVGPRDRVQQHTGTQRGMGSKTGTQTKALTGGDTEWGHGVGGPTYAGGRFNFLFISPVAADTVMLCKGGSGKRTPRNARVTGPEPASLSGHARVTLTSVRRARV